MYGSRPEIVVLWKKNFRIHFRHIKCFSDV